MKSLSEILAERRSLPGKSPEKATPASDAEFELIDNMEVGTLTTPDFNTGTSGLPELVSNLAASMNTPAISTALSEVLQHIDSFPETVDLLRPEEIGQIVRACARSFSVVKESKMQKTQKKRVKAEKVDQAANVLADIGF